MPLLQPNDVLFAHRALNITPELSAATRRVAGAIIDHFNRKTGQWDPSVGRLMRLLKVSRAAVIRATNELDDLGSIRKESDGGKSHRSFYTPNWAKFREIVEDWDDGMKTGDGPTSKVPKVSKPSSTQFQDCDLGGRKTEIQTHQKNQSNKPFERKPVERHAPHLNHRSKTQGIEQLLKSSIPRAQSPCLTPTSGGKSHSRSEIARDRAQQRLEAELMKLGEQSVLAIMDWLSNERFEAATDAELSEEEGGLSYILAAMGQQKSAGCGSVQRDLYMYRS